jgi:hypothetical protein
MIRHVESGRRKLPFSPKGSSNPIFSWRFNGKQKPPTVAGGLGVVMDVSQDGVTVVLA